MGDAAIGIATFIAREDTLAGMLDGCARAIAEAWALPSVRPFHGLSPDSGAIVYWDSSESGGFVLEGASDDIIAEVSRIVGVVGIAVERHRYRAMAEPLVDGLAIFDANDDRFVFSNEAMTRLTGFSDGPVWTPMSNDFLHRAFALRANAYTFGERRTYVDEVAVQRKDGSVVWAELTSYFLRDDRTGHLLICTAARPIGRSDLLEELQELANVGAWTVDPVTQDGRWTSQLMQIHEVEDDGQHISASLANFGMDGVARLSAVVNEAMASRRPGTVELPITTPKGNRKWLRITTKPVIEHGEIIRLHGTAQDITDRKLAELEVATQRAQVQSLLDNLPDIVSLRDLDNRVLACNARLERLIGVRPGELIGKVVPRVLEHEGPLSRPIRGERWVTFEDDGHRELVETLTAPIKDENGQVVAILGIGRDVTAARQTEEQLRAVQKMEAIGRLAGGVAHDFNNLLSVILSYTALAIESLPVSHPLQEDLQEILAAGKRGEGLTKQLLAFSRRQLLHMAPLDLADVVESVGSMLRRMVGEDIDFKFNRLPQPTTTKVDRGQIEQVIMNVVVNARDAMPDGGRLTISTTNVMLDEVRAISLDLPKGDYVELSVQDTGRGMDQATLRRVFEPFFTTKSVGKGTGLGLAMAYGIVRQSGGAIAIESVPGVGTTVRIFLPSFAAPPDAPESSRNLPVKEPGSETILVVEDEGPLRTVARRVLKGAGYDVFAAANAEEALRIAQEVGDRIDLVFTDVVMPGMNGGELVERLTALYPRMKVVFSSGYTDEKLARSGVGHHRFLPKPYEPAQLTAVIRSVLDSSK
jgi:PAS domain S-box-containing protein